MNEPDELYTARHLFYAESYESCLTELNHLPRMQNKSIEIEKAILQCKCQIGLGKSEEVMKDIQEKRSRGDNEVYKDASMESLLYLAMFEMYSKQNNANSEEQINKLKETIEDKVLESEFNNCDTFLFVAATIYSKLDLSKDALKLLGNIENPTFEHMALSASIYLSINRFDQAKQIADVMMDRDEDHTLSQLANAWVGIQSNDKDSAKEAAYIYQDMIMKFGPTTLLLNGAACANLVEGKYEDAFDSINQALEMAKETGAVISADTLINAIMCFIHLDKPPEDIMKYISLLMATYPNHPYVSKIRGIEEAFLTQEQAGSGN